MYTNLSVKQLTILAFLKDEIDEKGYAPSVREICEAVGLKSTSTVHSHLIKLEKHGYIRRDPTKPRALAILKAPRLYNSAIDEFLEDVNINSSRLPSVKTNDLDGFFSPIVEQRPYISILRYSGQSIDWANISTNDYVFVDTTRNINNDDIVLAVVNGEYSTIKKYYKDGDIIKLSSSEDCEEYIL